MIDLFAKQIAEAEEIAKSGRWAALNARLKELAAQPNQDDTWYLEV